MHKRVSVSTRRSVYSPTDVYMLLHLVSHALRIELALFVALLHFGQQLLVVQAQDTAAARAHMTRA